MIRSDLLIAAGVPRSAAERIAPWLQPAALRFGLGTNARLCAFLGQAHLESGAFRRLEENLLYTTAERIRAVWPSRFASVAAAQPFVRQPERLANHVYAGRLGNGPAASGDGWRFRGRGLKQLTGRANYARAAMGVGRPYLHTPDRVAEPEDAVLTAAWFWQAAGCNAMADRGDIDAITRAINGPAMLAAAERRALTARYRALMA